MIGCVLRSSLYVVHQIDMVPHVENAPIVPVTVCRHFCFGHIFHSIHSSNLMQIIHMYFSFNAGKCKGNGTRRGNGKCACFESYQGDNCRECAIGYYESFRDDKTLLCSMCHVSCDSDNGCTGAGPNGNLSLIPCLLYEQ